MDIMDFDKVPMAMLLLTALNFYCQTNSIVAITPYEGHSGPVQLQRSSSAPYISGDTFRQAADFIFDETRIPFDTDDVEPGDVIFVKTDFIEYFFTMIHPYINSPYIIITHNSDYSAPGKHAQYLDDSKLVAWFGQNSDIIYHPKFFPIPIGLANQHWSHGNIQIIQKSRELYTSMQKQWLLYMNFAQTNVFKRALVRDLFKDKLFCYSCSSKPYHKYLCDLACSKFVLSPEGNGLDCHRTWEALLLGAVPVVEHSTLDQLFEKLPVILIYDWKEITEEFLHKKYQEMSNQVFDLRRLFADYWLNRINELRERIRKKS